MAEENFGLSFTIDTTDLKNGLVQANRLIRESESEFKAAAAGMDNWTTSQEGLEARIKHLNKTQKLQEERLAALNKAYKEAGYSSDDMSSAAVRMRTEINKEKEALNKTKKELDKQKDAVDNLGKESKETGGNLKDMGDAGKKSSNALEGLGKGAKVVAKGVAAIGAACVGAATAFLSLAESTKETRVMLAKVEQSFATAGLGAENASNTLDELYGVLGDQDRASEAANLIAKMSKDEEDLAKNTRILTGVFAEYGVSIPTEGLAEAMAATSQMGVVQGVLADALEWQGINLDEYNAKLGTMTSAEERATYIQETLSDLYGKSADSFRENNKELIRANEAQLDLNKTLADMGSVAEPVMTSLKEKANDLLQSFTPFVKLIGEGMNDALNGTDGGAEKFADGINGIVNSLVEKTADIAPILVDVVTELLPKLVDTILEQAPVLLETAAELVVTLARGIAEAAPTLIPSVIEAVLQMVETLLSDECLGEIIDAALELIIALGDGLIDALPILIAYVPRILDKVVRTITENLPSIIEAGIELLMALLKGIQDAQVDLLGYMPEMIASLVTGLIECIPDLVECGWDLLKGLFEAFSPANVWSFIQGAGAAIVDGFKKVFKIKSPSRVMADVVGKNLALGIGKGFNDNIQGVNDDITSGMVGNVNANASGGAVGGGVVVYQTNNYSQAHSRYELYKSKQETANAVRLAIGGAK